MGNAYKAPYQVDTKGLEFAVQGMQQAFQNVASTQAKMTDLTQFFIPQGAQLNSTSASYVDVPGHAYTYTTGDIPERLFIYIQTLAKIAAAGNAVRLGISINGVDMIDGGGEAYSGNVDWTSQSTTATFDAAPNTTYTIKLRAKTSGASTLTVANDNKLYQRAFITSVPIGILLNTPQNSQRVSFSAYGSGTQTMTLNAWTKITLGIEDYDLGGNFDTSNSRFIVPVNGIYHFNGRWYNTTGGSLSRIIALFKNGAEIKRGNLLQGSANYQAPVVGADLKLQAGDYIEMFGYVENVNSSLAHSFSETYLTGHLITTI